jgi:hypothetical protein
MLRRFRFEPRDLDHQLDRDAAVGLLLDAFTGYGAGAVAFLGER